MYASPLATDRHIVCLGKMESISSLVPGLVGVAGGPRNPDHPGVNPSSSNYGCVTFGNLINHSVLQFSYLENKDANSTYFEGFEEII